MVVARTRWPHIGKPRTDVLGYSQPSLAGLWLLAGRDPGLTSWATFSRPYGTQVREASSHADSEGAGRWYFPSCQRPLNQEDALSAPYLHNADVSRGGGGGCTGGECRCKAMQGRRGKTALMWVLGSTVVRFLDLVQGDNFGNRGGALLVPYRARIDCGKRAS